MQTAEEKILHCLPLPLHHHLAMLNPADKAQHSCSDCITTQADSTHAVGRLSLYLR